MKNTGVVIEIKNNKAKVRFIRESACGGNCASCGGCGSTPIEIYVENTLNAEIYDKVEVESDSKKVIFSAFILYIFPLIIFTAAYGFLNMIFSEAVAVISGVIGFFMSFFVIRIYGDKYKITAEMTRIIKE